MIAVVPVRGGALPPGGDEAVAEAGGQAVLVGEGAAAAAERLTLEDGPARLRAWAAGAFQPDRWARGLAPILEDEDVVILPASADGRDLAPRLAERLGRPLVAAAIEVSPTRIVALRHEGRVMDTYRLDRPVVATLVPGCRGVDPGPGRPPAVEVVPVDPAGAAEAADPEVVDVLDPDPSTMDLADATRVVGAGSGLGGTAGVAAVAGVAEALGAAVGATRLVVDMGWLPFERQIGTTGAEIDPDLYLAFGISGAIQHLAGLGDPDHVVSVNLDPSCPMMAMADLAVVSDAPAVADQLLTQLRLCGGYDANSVRKRRTNGTQGVAGG